MNAYYATGFISALVLWVWPVYFFKNLEASAVVVAFFATLLFLAAGRMISALHIRFIAPMVPPMPTTDPTAPRGNMSDGSV